MKVVLAYSGGLDTACILKLLIQRGHDVIAFAANVGQQEDFAQINQRALATGASKYVQLDLREELVREYIFPAIAGNAVYENRYLLGTSLARPLIAKKQVELAFAALAPGLEVIAPWKESDFLERFKGRSDLLRFAREEGIEIEATAEKPYSTDENIMHRSYEAGVLEDPKIPPPDDMYKLVQPIAKTPDKPASLEIHFKNALPVRVVDLDAGASYDDALSLFEFLNEAGGRHGIGRVDMVENRFVGIKSRAVYETPAGTILHQALRDLEGIAMDREVLRLRDGLSPKFTELIYNGFWFSPEMDFIRAAFARSEELIDGVVRLRLLKGNVIMLGRESPSSLYDRDLASMDVEGGYDQKDARGFIKINALRLKAHKVIVKKATQR